MRAFLDRILTSWLFKGSGAPTLLPRLSNQNLCWVLVSPWGFSPPFQGKSQSPCFRAASRGHSPVGGRTEGWAMQPGARSGEESAQAPLRGPFPTRAWCPPLSGPLARLFCALVTYESSPSLGPQSVPDTPWGLPVKLLALRLLQCWARRLGQASGVARTTSPLPLPTSPPIYLEPPRAGAPWQAGLTPASLRKSLETDMMLVHTVRMSCPHLGLGCLGRGIG